MIKKYIFWNILVICSIGTMLYGQIHYQATFSSSIVIAEDSLDDGNFYSVVELPETLMMDSIGFPSLPVKYVKFIVPSNAGNLNVVINHTTKQNYTLQNKVAPLQAPIPTGFSPIPDFVKPDTIKYNSEAPYPAERIKILQTGIFRGNHLVTVAIFPCQYYATQNKLEYFDTIHFSLTYTEKSTRSNNRTMVQDSNELRSILGSIVENTSDINAFSTIRSCSEINKKQNVTPFSIQDSVGNNIAINCDYVIVTSQNLAPAFSKFMAWKRRKGIPIQLITIETIQSNYIGDHISGIHDDAGKLRQFLADAYNNGNGVKYALLGGNSDILPIRHGYNIDNTTDTSFIIPTDLYFAEFDGDWDTDNDGRYGEPSDHVDFEPEVYIGRVLVSNPDEVKNWTRKVILYESNPGKGDYDYLIKSYYTQADQMQQYNWAAYISSVTTWCTSLIHQEQGGGNTSSTPSFPTGHDVISEFNNYYGFCSFLAHGGPTNIAVATKEFNAYEENSKYKITSFENGYAGCCDIEESENGFDNMTNIHHPSIYYSISCKTMPFDNYETPDGERNMGEVFTCISKGGGPAYLGNTRNGYVQRSSGLFIKFANIIAFNISFHMGIVEAISKQSYYDQYVCFSHNLIGCPETEIWTAIPSKFTNVSISETQNGNITVNTGGVNGATICVMSALDNGNSYYEVLKNVSSGGFIGVPQPYLVTITKHNYIPYLKNLDNMYIQNESFYSDRYIYGKYFYAGENVTTSKPQGLVKIKRGATVIFDAANDVNLESGFEVELGGSFEVKTEESL